MLILARPDPPSPTPCRRLRRRPCTTASGRADEPDAGRDGPRGDEQRRHEIERECVDLGGQLDQTGDDRGTAGEHARGAEKSHPAGSPEPYPERERNEAEENPAD
jgi:hypothetical protein